LIGKKRENIVASLDIGTTKVVAMIATQEEPDQLKLIGLGEVESKGMKRGVVMNIQEMVDSITEAVLKAETEAGNSISKVYAGIAGDHIESINSRGAVVLPKPHSEITQ
jgi:cell division protein FtsA